MAKWILNVACVATLAAAGSVSTAAAQDAPLKATFRCANSSACPATGPTDGIQGDGTTVNGHTFDGYTVFTAGKGKGTTYIDGAYLNVNGGISIRLVPGGTTPERALQFRFAGRQLDLPGTPPSACDVDGATLSATDVDFRFNVPGGIESMTPGTTEEATLVGVVNFTTATIRGSLYFNHSHDDTTPWQGGVTLARGADDLANTWVLTSDSVVLLQCAGAKGRLYDVGTYHMPFQLQVER